MRRKGVPKHGEGGGAKKPREVSLRIEDVAFGGDGVGRVEGKVWFVPFTLPGELVRARVVRERKDFVKAELVAVDVPSESRVDAPCAIYGVCGGCKYQHINYAAQLELKQQQVKSLLARIGKIENARVLPMIGMPERQQFAYRNRITVHIEDGRVGFHRVDGRGLVDVSECLLADARVNKKLAAFRSRRVFDGHRTLRADESAAHGFRQTNDHMAGVLRDFVCGEFASGGDLLLDVFGGAGFFGKSLRENFQSIVGIDWSESAIEAALADATEGEIYFREDAAEGLRKSRDWAAERGLSPGCRVSAVVDPPSEGLEESVCREIFAWNWQHWIYISCNPATFARDALRLAPRYELVSVQPFDMFPQTAEIEIAGIFKARSPEGIFCTPD